jgi:hypothetical protein
MNLTHSTQKDKSVPFYCWIKHLVAIKLYIYDVTLTSISPQTNEKHTKIHLFKEFLFKYKCDNHHILKDMQPPTESDKR